MLLCGGCGSSRPPAGPAPPAAPAAVQAPGGYSYDQARLQVETTIGRQPADYELRINAGQFYMEAGDFEAAIRHLKTAADLKPKELLPWLALGDAASLSGRLDEADRAFQRAARLNRDHPLLLRSQAQLLLLRRKPAAARALLERGLKRHPEDAEIRTALGNVYLVENRPRPAIQVLRPAVESSPERADLHYLLAEAYERDLKMEAAIEELRESVRLAPDMHEAWGRLALYLVDLTRYEEARLAAERAINLQPSVSHYHWVLGDAFLLDKGAGGSVETALGHLRRAIELDKNNDRAIYSLAMALTRHGGKAELIESEALFRSLLKVNPNDPNARFKLSETLRRLGRTAEADRELALFRKASRRDTGATQKMYRTLANRDTALAHLEEGRRLLEAGKKDEAAKQFRRALERDPGLAAARDGLRRATGGSR